MPETVERAVERAAFLVEAPVALGSHVTLSEADTRHISVLRLAVGERVGLRDGAGLVASGVLVRLGKKQALVEVDDVHEAEAPPAIHLLLPVADRERMLWLAEKAAELNVATWRPVLWQRSRSVSPRGDGPTFRTKVRSRMIAALLQSRSAWLPDLYPEALPDHAIAAAPQGTRLVFDASGAPTAVAMLGPVTIAIGPEGGFEPRELAALADAGFLAVAVGSSILRFETAAIVAVGMARSMLAISTSNNS